MNNISRRRRAKKVRVCYILRLTPKQKKVCVQRARELGYEFGGVKPLMMLKRLFQYEGERAIMQMLEEKLAAPQMLPSSAHGLRTK